jgi:Zn-finger protein
MKVAAIRVGVVGIVIVGNYKYFCNTDCEYFPCHNNVSLNNFNCLFCYCPLYFKQCGGQYITLENGIKDCSMCKVPHDRNNYDYIVGQIIKINKEKPNEGN